MPAPKKIMSDLANKKCVPCEGNIPPFNAEEIHKYLKKVDGWEVLEDKIDGFHLIKNFKFDNFLKSQEFVNKVGQIAEAEGHHPDLWFCLLYTSPSPRDGTKSRMPSSA